MRVNEIMQEAAEFIESIGGVRTGVYYDDGRVLYRYLVNGRPLILQPVGGAWHSGFDIFFPSPDRKTTDEVYADVRAYAELGRLPDA
jgi:hypothetical protein